MGSLAGDGSLGGASASWTPWNSNTGAPRGHPMANSLDEAIQREYLLPPKRRRLLNLGGFPQNTSAELIVPVLDGIRQRFPKITHAFPRGRITSKALIVMQNNEAVWSLLKSMKNQKFQFDDGGSTIQLWHGFDKTPDEQLVSKRTSYVMNKLKEALVAAGTITSTDAWKEALGGDWDIGLIWARVVLPGKVVKSNVPLVRCKKGSVDFNLEKDHAKANLPPSCQIEAWVRKCNDVELGQPADDPMT